MSTVGSATSVASTAAAANASVMKSISAAQQAQATTKATQTSAAASATTDASGRVSVQISLPDPSQMKTSDPALEAAVQRVSTILYLRAHCQMPPEALDMGAGVFNIVV